MALSPFRSPVLFQCRFLSEAASLSACSRQCSDSAAQTDAFLVLGVAYAYTPLGQQATVTDGAGTRTFAYDELTQSLTQEIFSGTVNGTLNRTYDTYNRPTGYVLLDANNPTTALTAATYAYDTTGNFSQVQGDTVPSQFSTSNYTTTALTPATFTYNRLANSDLLASVVGPVHTVFNTYETNRDVITSKQNKVTTGTNATINNGIVSQYDYTVNAIGQRTARAQSGTAFTTAASTDTFTYNTRSEVTASTNNQIPASNRAYTYDPIGNRLTSADGSTASPTLSQAYTSNNLNQYTAIQTTVPTPPTTATPTYDDDGNTLTDGTGKIYTWDCENRLIQVTLPTTEIVRYYYDAQSRRIKREHITPTKTETTTYLYDGWNVIHEPTTTTETQNGTTTNILSTKSYVWGLDLSDMLQGVGGVGGLLTTKHTPDTTLPTQVQQYHHTYDANGNTSELFNTTGTITAHYEYDAFGKETTTTGAQATNNTYRFSTKPCEQTTLLNYYGFRFYNPENGRWINRDPLFDGVMTTQFDIFSKTAKDTFAFPNMDDKNIFSFAKNNPIQHIDVFGLCSCGPDVTDWLLNQMNKNKMHRTIQKMRNNRWVRWVPGFGIGFIGGFLYDFSQLVKDGGEWDFKAHESFSTSSCPTSGVEMCSSTVTLCGGCYHKDIVGNIHYGFVGAYAGLRDWVLHSGAGVAQNGLPWGDENEDSAAIDIGIYLARNGGTPTQEELCKQTQNRREELLESQSRQAKNKNCAPCDEKYE